MSSVIFQIVGQDGMLASKEIDWQEGELQILETIVRTVDIQPEDSTVFIIVDLYSVHKERKKSQAEIIVDKQVEEVKKKENIPPPEQTELWKESA